MVKLSSSMVLRVAAIALAPIVAPCSSWAQQVVGIVGAANATPTGRAPGKPQRMLKAGSDIYFKDRIVTKRGGSAQLAFLDRSTLNVSENSDLVIDEFVYRPGEPGTMTAHLSRGVMRFVGGDISHEGAATIKTPVVTIGIRGGIGTIGYIENAKDLAAIPGVPADFHGGTIVVNGYGTMTVRNGTGETVISRPGFAVFVGGPNETIAAPVRFDMASAKAMMSALGSRPGQRGGLSRKAAAGAPSSIGGAHLALPVAAPRTPGVNALDFTSIFHAGNSLARNRSQAQQAIRLQVQIVTAPSSVTPISTAPGSVSNEGSTATGPLAGGPHNGPIGGGSFPGPVKGTPTGPMPTGPIGGGTPPRPVGGTPTSPIGGGMPAGPIGGGPMPGPVGGKPTAPVGGGMPPRPGRGGWNLHIGDWGGGYDNGIGNGGRNNGHGNGGRQGSRESSGAGAHGGSDD